MFSMGRSRVAVIAFALAGLVLVAGVTYLASRLVSQPIGLASEPATLGRSLAPIATTTGTSSTPPQTTTQTVTTTTPPAQTTTTPPAQTTTTPDADDHGSRGNDGDDD